MPKKLDRVYDLSLAQPELDWQPKFGYDAVLKMLDDGISEVLPAANINLNRS